MVDDQHKSLLRNYLLLGVVFFAVYSWTKHGDVSRLRASAEQARKSAELCRPQLAECRRIRQEEERKRPKVPRAPRQAPTKNPCPPVDPNTPMVRPCPAPDE